ncbi:MAG: hypothetical protein K2J83_07755 [Clostridia bacterium]|nr:hypothetical protein [Clostridia bacterium]
MKNETTVMAKSLLEEILPILDDYFIGEIALGEKGITYILPNGQKFIISAKQQ